VIQVERTMIVAVVALALILAGCVATTGKKEAPTVVVTVRGATVTSTGTVYVEFPEVAATKGEVFTAAVGDGEDTSVGGAGLLASPWIHGLIYIVAGGLLVYLFQYVKGKLRLSGRVALAVVSAICAGAGVGLSSVLGGLNVLSAGGGAALVLASAQLIYKLFVK